MVGQSKKITNLGVLSKKIKGLPAKNCSQCLYLITICITYFDLFVQIFFFFIVYFDSAAYRDHFDMNIFAQSQVLFEILTFQSLFIPKNK